MLQYSSKHFDQKKISTFKNFAFVKKAFQALKTHLTRV